MKKTILIIIALIILGGGIFLIVKMRSPKVNMQTGAGPSSTPAETKAQTEAKKYEQIIQEITATDSDLDGLTNDEEKKLGTNPNNPDTDNDGLLDGDEVKIYHTDPLKADTDGDGYTDGYEVRHHMNPLVPDKKK